MRTYLFSLFSLLFFPVTTLWGHSSINEELLEKLDKVIEEKDRFHHERESQIESIKQQLILSKEVDKQYDLCGSLFTLYLHYQADSALYYIDRKLAMLPLLNEPERRNEIFINRAEVMGVMGMYAESIEQLKAVAVGELDGDMLNYYYRTNRACYGWLADYTNHKEEKQKYIEITNCYRDSVIATTHNEIDREISKAEEAVFLGKAEQSLEKLHSLLEEKPTLRQEIYINYALYELYNSLNQVEKRNYHLAATAILDLESATREYASLQKLAQMMYQQGDLTRAYRYLNCSMEDAASCNARLRFIEVTQFFPIIDKAYKLKAASEKRNAHLLLVFISILSLFLSAAVFFLYRWMRKLSAMRRTLSLANEQLHTMNSELGQTGRIKEVYIAHYLDRCVSYLDKLEAYRRSLAKLAKSSRLEDLYAAIKSEQLMKDERKAFYKEFDNSFLKLFPHYISSFNKLLVEDAQISPKPGELLTTELRIFALIRLGVTDSARIAHFLGYSLATIYNYRSKMRHKAVGSKENFEEEIMNLQ
ncbi:MAG: DUF6377 domain-containing protein [Phocaeicola sp.]